MKDPLAILRLTLPTQKEKEKYEKAVAEYFIKERGMGRNQLRKISDWSKEKIRKLLGEE